MSIDHEDTSNTHPAIAPIWWDIFEGGGVVVVGLQGKYIELYLWNKWLVFVECIEVLRISVHIGIDDALVLRVGTSSN